MNRFKERPQGRVSKDEAPGQDRAASGTLPLEQGRLTNVYTNPQHDRMHASGFDWDSGNWPKCGKHGVARSEIEAFFESGPLVLPDRTLAGNETRLNAVGRSAVSGRHLFVVFTLRRRAGEVLIRPKSARFMHAKEVANYERQTKAP